MVHPSNVGQNVWSSYSWAAHRPGRGPLRHSIELIEAWVTHTLIQSETPCTCHIELHDVDVISAFDQNDIHDVDSDDSD